MDYKDFAEQFQRRLTKRMNDFEAALIQAQKLTEEQVRQHERAREMNIQKPPPMTPRGTLRGGRGGQVQGVLRRENPGRAS